MTVETISWLASIFLWLFFTGLGLPPVPEEAGILYASGLVSLHPDVPWWLAWPAASLGIICADVTLYGLGRWMGQRIFQYRWVSRILPPERRQRLEARFHEHGIKFLLTARLLPPLRSGVFLIAGSSHYPLARFLLAEAVYGVFGVGLLFFGGAALLVTAHSIGGWLVLLALLALGAYLLRHYFLHLKKRELKTMAPLPGAVSPDAPFQPEGDRPGGTESNALAGGQPLAPSLPAPPRDQAWRP